MSSYRFVGPVKLIPTGAMSGTSVITSQVFDLRSLEGCAFAPVWTGTPTGLFLIQVSLDYEPNPSGGTPRNSGTWIDLGASISGNPSGAAGNIYIPVYASCAPWIRLQYTNASGSGVLAGMFIGKTRG